MSYERPQISITLPRNFTFHYTDGQPPKTPEPQLAPEQIEEPPKLRQPTYRIRRRRGPLPSYDVNANSRQDVPIPSIEAVEVRTGSSFSNDERPEYLEGYLQPAAMLPRFVSPPKTPVAQISPLLVGDERRQAWFGADDDAISQGESISRPSSACSGFSDSSFISTESFGGSCTSPESECSDPFTYSSKSHQLPSSPTAGLEVPFEQRQRLKRKAPKAVFTEDMDRHLWMTYMNYLQDPTFTPFKMLPGVAPPLGVCVRVARTARKTWKGPRTAALRRISEQCGGSPDTVKGSKSGSTTPTMKTVSRTYISWPKENALTRKRLRDLIKRKPSLSAHYARLVNCRTPSPFPSSPRADPPSQAQAPAAGNDESSFTRDMNMSLATSTSTTMQYGNPLSNLASGQDIARAGNDEWFGQPMSRPPIVSHQKSQSLEFSHSSGPGSIRTSQRPLRSPFHERNSHRASRNRRPNYAAVFGDNLEQPHAPLPLPRSFKRRAQRRSTENMNSQDPSTREAVLQELFGVPAEISHRRVRSRGFSLGDMGDGARQLSSLFTPPGTLEQNPFESTHNAPELLAPPPGPPTMRLGSPFGGGSTNVHFNNTFPRNFTPHTFEPPASFEDRLAHMN